MITFFLTQTVWFSRYGRLLSLCLYDRFIVLFSFSGPPGVSGPVAFQPWLNAGPTQVRLSQPWANLTRPRLRVIPSTLAYSRCSRYVNSGPVMAPVSSWLAQHWIMVLPTIRHWPPTIVLCFNPVYSDPVSNF